MSNFHYANAESDFGSVTLDLLYVHPGRAAVIVHRLRADASPGSIVATVVGPHAVKYRAAVAVANDDNDDDDDIMGD